METDWQHGFKSVQECGAYLLRTGKYVDCSFVVGTAPNQKLIPGHKLYFSMASCVFHQMFCEKEPNNVEPFSIPDVTPDVFAILMEDIYANKLNITSFDLACALYTAGKNYKLVRVEQKCRDYLRDAVSPNNACRLYELSEKFDDAHLKDESMKIIINETTEVLADPTFLRTDVSTILMILDQNVLDVSSELVLFESLMEYAKERCAVGDWRCLSRLNKDSCAGENVSTQTENISVDRSHGDDADASDGAKSCGDGDKLFKDNETCENRRLVHIKYIRKALKKLRFLTLTPKQFADGPAYCKFLSNKEALGIFIRICSAITIPYRMPEGFTKSREKRKPEEYRGPLTWDKFYPID